MDAVVSCYAGHRYPERPRAFLWQGEQMTVEAVERQWRTPTGMGFCVRTARGSRFTLVYKEASDSWTVSPLAQPVT